MTGDVQPAAWSQGAAGIAFGAEALQQMTIKYAGNAVNWPIVTALAQHNIAENRFYLSDEARLRLNNLGKTSQQVNQLQQRISELVQSGATIFAKQELTQANELVTSYREAIKQGDIATA